jgi:hypothetical protein
MEDLDNQGVLVDINIIIVEGTRPKDHMYVRGRKETKLCLFSNTRGGYMGQLACKGSSRRSIHHHLMERIGREQLQKRGCCE